MKKLILISLYLALYLGARATDTRTLSTTAGNLKANASVYLSTVTHLTVTGTIDARDFKTMRDNMPMLQSLDISAVTVAAYNGTGGTTDFGTDYPANTLPDGAFVSSGLGGISTASTIILPNSITSIALAGGSLFPSNLTSLTIGNGITSIEPMTLMGLSNLTDLTLGSGITNIFDINMFQSITSLKTIIVTSGNPKFSSVDGVLMDKAQTTLIYCPAAKAGNITIPATITSIPDLFFSNRTGITSFTPKHTDPTSLTFGTMVFDGIDKTKCTLYVPPTTLTAYSAISEWSGFTHKYQGNGLWIETTTNTLAKEGKSTKIANVNSNIAWTATSNQTWLTLNTGVTGFGELTATATANTTLSARQATVTVAATGLSSQTLVVTQGAGTATLTVDSTTVGIAKLASSTAAVNVTSNTTWTATSNQEWLTVPTGYTGDHLLTFTAITANPSITTRQAIVTLKAAGATDKIITITQAAGDIILSVSATSFHVGKGANEQDSVRVTSNTNWTATSNQEWCILSNGLVATGLGMPVNGNGNATFTFFTDSANPLTTTRTATITLTAIGAITKTITVTQAAGDVVPLLTSSVTSLSSLNYTYGSGPSTVKSFTVAGSSLSGDIILKPSSHIEISKSPTSGFGTTALTVTQSGGRVDSARIYVRLKAGLVAATYSDTLYISSSGAVSKTVYARGTVASAATPQLTTSTSWLDGMNYSNGLSESTVKSFVVGGSSLTGNIIITPSSNLEISKDLASGFGIAQLTVIPSGGKVDSARIYVRLKPGLLPGVYSDTLTVASTGAASKLIYLMNNVSPAIVTGDSPIMSTSTYTLSGLNYTYGSGPSAVQSFTVGGSSLTGNIIITPSSRYQISKSPTSGFGTVALTFTQTTGRVDSARIYVRLKAGLAVGAYNDSLTISTTGAFSKTVYISGAVSMVPQLTTSTYTLSGLNYTYGSGPSAVQSFTVGGSSLTGSIVITPSSRYQISKSPTSGFGTVALTFTQTTGRVDSARIYVRLKAGLAIGAYNDSLTISTTGAFSKTVYISGAVSMVPQLTTSTYTLSGLNYTYGSGPSAVQSFTVGGSSLTGSIVITPSSRYQISKSPTSGFGTVALTFTQTTGRVDSARIYVRLKAGLAIGAYNDSLTISTTGAFSKTVYISGAVSMVPQLTTSTYTLSGLNYTYGSGPSAVQSFTVGGSSLTESIIISPSTYCEISKSPASGFGTVALTFTQTTGRVDSARIYVRLKAGLADGAYNDSLTISTVGAFSKTVSISGAVSMVPQLTSSTYTLSGLNYTYGSGPSAVQSFTVGGSSLTGDITISSSPRFEISQSPDSGFTTSTLNIFQKYGKVDTARVYVRLKVGLTTGVYNDSLILRSSKAAEIGVHLSGIVSAIKISGCTKISAKNYNPLATIDDGSCKYDTIIVISGCTKKLALNYNPKATVDNGSCQFDSTKVIMGCTDKKAINYNTNATVNNDSCMYELTTVVYGCTDPKAMNYNSFAKIDNNNCIYKQLIPGCTDSLAINYNKTASVNDGSCKYSTKIWGCMDPLAQNYDPKANHDNGECTYALTIKGCTDAAALNYNPAANQENGSCIFNPTIALGCIDAHALNYNPFANKDNGSCVYITISDTIKGCTDATAVNYNPIAMKSDNSKCIYSIDPVALMAGCMSPMALNYNDKAVVDNGSCVFAKPMNLVTIVVPEATVVADTLAKVQEGFCSFNYSIAIDTVYIISTKIINTAQIEVTWGIRQGSLETTVKQLYNIGKDGNTLLYLSLVCKSATPNSGTRRFAKDSGNGTLEAITISSVLRKTGNPTGESPILSSNDFKLYPVPVHNEMHIEFNSKENENIQYNVFSIEGMRVSTGQLSFANGQNQLVLNTSTWSTGMYLIRMYRDGRLINTQKIIKE